MENTNDDDISESVFEKTNYLGDNVPRIMAGEITEEVQLKSIDQPELVRKYLEKYTHIPAAMTDGVASKMEGIGHSGLLDSELGKQVTIDNMERMGTTVHRCPVALLSLPEYHWIF